MASFDKFFPKNSAKILTLVALIQFLFQKVLLPKLAKLRILHQVLEFLNWSKNTAAYCISQVEVLGQEILKLSIVSWPCARYDNSRYIVVSANILLEEWCFLLHQWWHNAALYHVCDFTHYFSSCALAARLAKGIVLCALSICSICILGILG